MCARMTVLTYDEALGVLLALRAGSVANPFPDWPAVPPRKDAFPQSWVPVMLPAPEQPDELDVQTLSWGYPVQWQPRPVFNTRIESILQGSGIWRESAEHRRCLVPTVRFYERHASESVRNPKTRRTTRRMYEFKLVDEPITWLAGIYENDHFSVVTTRPNRQMAPIHNRMPLVLRQSELPLWLGDDYPALADRSATELAVHPELLPGEEDTNAQLSLF